jgi:hypothetical protein
MKKTGIAITLAFALPMLYIHAQGPDNPPAATEGSSDSAQPPAGPPRDGGGPGHGGFHMLPPHARELLKLTDDQQKQITALEAEVKEKMEKILTPGQLEQLKKMRPPHPGGGGPGAPGSSGGGPDGDSGPGGKSPVTSGTSVNQ